jgi:hypothetical protein
LDGSERSLQSGWRIATLNLLLADALWSKRKAMCPGRSISFESSPLSSQWVIELNAERMQAEWRGVD